MQVFVFTYDRYDSISTSLMLEEGGVDHTVLCHTADARDAFVAAGRVKPERIVVTYQPKGLAYNRDCALDMMDHDEWALFLVDDLKSVSEVASYDSLVGGYLGITTANQRAFRDAMQVPIGMERFRFRAEQLTEACEQVGARLGGFCGIANPVFRDAKWRFNVVADGRAWVVKKGSLRFDHNVQLIDDVCWTARNIERYGTVVVNQWVLPDCRRYTAGGFGSITERLPQKMAEAAYLVEHYPRTVRFADKAGWPPGSHVTLKRTLSGKQVREMNRILARQA